MLLSVPGALANYKTFELDNRDRCCSRRVCLGCLRANETPVSHPKWDGLNLVLMGGSPGRALSIVVAGPDSRAKLLAAHHPALSDVMGYLNNRAASRGAGAVLVGFNRRQRLPLQLTRTETGEWGISTSGSTNSRRFPGPAT